MNIAGCWRILQCTTAQEQECENSKVQAAVAFLDGCAFQALGRHTSDFDVQQRLHGPFEGSPLL